jgi:hypothetical protein
MKLQTLEGVGKTMGGRPKTQSPKRRHSFYLNAKESELLKIYVNDNEVTVSQFVRSLINGVINSKK